MGVLKIFISTIKFTLDHCKGSIIKENKKFSFIFFGIFLV